MHQFDEESGSYIVISGSFALGNQEVTYLLPTFKLHSLVNDDLVYLLKTENLWLVVFSGYRNENIGLKWVKASRTKLVLFTRFI